MHKPSQGSANFRSEILIWLTKGLRESTIGHNGTHHHHPASKRQLCMCNRSIVVRNDHLTLKSQY
jgi:hypothetical protein